MRPFLKKEWMEWCRTGHIIILLLVFAVFGIMNPAVAKLTPWLMDKLTDTLTGSNITITTVTVDAMTSWAQFYKNIPVGLIAFVLICSSCFTGEYQQGTLILVVTRGLSHRKIMMAKSLMLFGSWTVCYLLCFGITYGYNAYFWDNGIAEHLLLAQVCTWIFGIWVIALLIFFSATMQRSVQVLLCTGGVVIISYVLSLFSKCRSFVPIKLMNGMDLLQGSSPAEYYTGMIAAGSMILLCMVLGMILFDRRSL